MLILIKALALFLSIVFIMPVVFFILMGVFGSCFELTIDRDSWLAKTKIRWLRVLVQKIFVLS